jgi:MOSC domain-containing protein YiiM
MTHLLHSIPLAWTNALACNRILTNRQKVRQLSQKHALIFFDGMENDQGDREYFTDPDKALMHYAFEHYAWWRQFLSPTPIQLAQAGAFSENISTLGVTEHHLCVGDILLVGTALLQVSQGREACSTMNQRFNRPGMNNEMHITHRNGWFYRVLEQGRITIGDALFLRERPNPQWTIARVQSCLFSHRPQPKELEKLAVLSGLSHDWQTQFQTRLNNPK